VYKTLRKRGIITFGDMRNGVCDSVNPRGYKVRMTAVDITRWKIVVLPDDMSFYGIDPDRFEVAKAVRMSTSVPFAFKPVEIRKEIGGGYRKYHFVDGGVLDGMPSWLIDDSGENTVIGLRLKSESKQNVIDTPLKILKALIFFVHNTGVPKNVNKLKYVADIDTTDVSFLDFNLSDKDKIYLYRMGRYYANILLNKMESRSRYDNPFNTLISRLLGKF
jgi:NTE family protein